MLVTSWRPEVVVRFTTIKTHHHCSCMRADVLHDFVGPCSLLDHLTNPVKRSSVVDESHTAMLGHSKRPEEQTETFRSIFSGVF